jgi:3-deoxy-manno-octulosonate cytidylyltransferase (CMP-KDO synthetase)
VPMVVRSAGRAIQAKAIDRVVVATDDTRIVEVCSDYGLDSVVTSADHPTGTDRVAEAAACLGVTDVVNVQGDEPLIIPETIDALISGLILDPSAEVANAACLLTEDDEHSSNVVKVAATQQKHLLYFSRHPIPFAWEGSIPRLRHLGLYAFQNDALSRYTARLPGPLEQAERIEMFRFLEYDDPIALIEVPENPPAVDAPEDLGRVEEYVACHGGWEAFPLGSDTGLDNKVNVVPPHQGKGSSNADV